MSPEQKRRANRLRVAASVSDKPTPPGFTGPEIIALNKLNPAISPNTGHTEFEGGWQATNDYLILGRGEAA